MLRDFSWQDLPGSDSFWRRVEESANEWVHSTLVNELVNSKERFSQVEVTLRNGLHRCVQAPYRRIDHRMAKSKCCRWKRRKYTRVDIGVVAAVFTQLPHPGVAEYIGQPVGESDVLQFGADDFPGLVEETGVSPVGVDPCQASGNTLVLPEPKKMDGGEIDLLIDPTIAGHQTLKVTAQWQAEGPHAVCLAGPCKWRAALSPEPQLILSQQSKRAALAKVAHALVVRAVDLRPVNERRHNVDLASTMHVLEEDAADSCSAHFPRARHAHAPCCVNAPVARWDADTQTRVHTIVLHFARKLATLLGGVCLAQRDVVVQELPELHQKVVEIVVVHNLLLGQKACRHQTRTWQLSLRGRCTGRRYGNQRHRTAAVGHPFRQRARFVDMVALWKSKVILVNRREKVFQGLHARPPLWVLKVVAATISCAVVPMKAQVVTLRLE